MHTAVRIGSFGLALIVIASIVLFHGRGHGPSPVGSDWNPATIVAALGSLFTATTVAIAIRQFFVAQGWKRYEFSLQEIRNIDASPGARNAILMLSWPWRPIHIYGHSDSSAWLDIDEKTAAKMILPYDIFPYANDPLRIAVYDSFIDFFERLGNFQRLIRRGLIRKRDVQHYIDKVGVVIGHGRRKNDELALSGLLSCAVRAHLHRYDRPDLRQLLDEYDLRLSHGDLRRLREELTDVTIPDFYDAELQRRAFDL